MRIPALLLGLCLALPPRAHAEDAALRPTTKSLTTIAGLSSSTKNVSVGVSLCSLGYLRSELSTDYLMSAFLTGFDHDDLDSLRFAGSLTVGTRIALGPLRAERRCGSRPRVEKRVPDLILGAGLYGAAEADSLSQAFRTGHAGVFLGWAVGGFASLVFNDVTLTMLFRPFEQTAFYLADDWDATAFRFNNPTLEIELSYVLPW